jgi:SAM-dependent methyltransferase
VSAGRRGRQALRRLASSLDAARQELASGTRREAPTPLAGPYFIKHGYRERSDPRYDDLTKVGTKWQAPVYRRAAEQARALDAARVIDVGCGDGRNLSLIEGIAIVGLDYGSNLESARAAHPDVDFIEIDLDADEPALPLETAGAVIVCADVIEHLRRPERLLARLRRALVEGAQLVLLSTPERDLWRGKAHYGPPPNETHVREWNASELNALLSSMSLVGTLEVVQSNDLGPDRKTLLATITGVR